MKKVLSIVAICSLLSACINKHANADTDKINNRYYHEYALIYKAYGKVPLDTTMDQLKKYLKEFPKGYEGWTFLGKVYADKRQYENSEMAYKNALSFNPKFTPAMSGLGATYIWTGKNDSAVEYIHRGIAAGDSSSGNYLRLAIADVRKGDTAAAKMEDEQIRQVDSLDNNSLIFLAWINRELKRENNVSSAVSLLQKRNVRDSLLNSYLDGKISGTEFFDQKVYGISHGK